MRTALPEAAYSMVPEGLRAIWLIWCSPGALVMARVDAAAQASPEITWPEDLPVRERGQVTDKGQETNQASLRTGPSPTSSRKPSLTDGQDEWDPSPRLPSGLPDLRFGGCRTESWPWV